MDWKILATTFGSVFLAELGDKTQLATLAFSAETSSKWSVFFGSALALILTSAIAVLVGEAVSRAINPLWIKRAAGTAFVVIGVLTLVRS